VIFSVSATEYQAIEPGRSQLDLTIGHGALGIEYAKDQKLT
jgi:hypothetical protein